MTHDPSFDPDGASLPSSGIYGLPHTPDTARVVVLPVPFAATTSYRRGAHHGPDTVLSASRQVDLHDLEWGDFWSAGIAMLPTHESLAGWNAEASELADRVIAVGGQIGDDPKLHVALARVNALCEQVNDSVRAAAAEWIARGRLVATLGGDHAVPLGAIAAHAERYPGMGILHLDAHADLRVAYEGFAHSHASIMANVLDRVPGVSRIVQVGVRDFGAAEHQRIRDSNGRVVTFFDHELAEAEFNGTPWRQTVDSIVEKLPREVYLSFDIDGLDPALCPSTGTPVPGGLSFREVCALLGGVVRAGKRIVGLDLVEVAPGPDGDEWNGNVAARLLYKMIGASLASWPASGRWHPRP